MSPSKPVIFISHHKIFKIVQLSKPDHLSEPKIILSHETNKSIIIWFLCSMKNRTIITNRINNRGQKRGSPQT